MPRNSTPQQGVAQADPGNYIFSCLHVCIRRLSLLFCNLTMATAQHRPATLHLGVESRPPRLHLAALVLEPPARKRRLNVNSGLGMPRNSTPQQGVARADPGNYIFQLPPCLHPPAVVAADVLQPDYGNRPATLHLGWNPGLHVCILELSFWNPLPGNGD